MFIYFKLRPNSHELFSSHFTRTAFIIPSVLILFCAYLLVSLKPYQLHRHPHLHLLHILQKFQTFCASLPILVIITLLSRVRKTLPLFSTVAMSLITCTFITYFLFLLIVAVRRSSSPRPRQTSSSRRSATVPVASPVTGVRFGYAYRFASTAAGPSAFAKVCLLIFLNELF